MTAFRISGFSGLVPRLAKQLLAPNQAQVATNCSLTSGDIRPRNGLKLVFVPVIANDIVSMFRMEKNGNEKWMAWDKDVDVARSPVADNTSGRFYYTGDGEPRASDYDTATAGARALSFRMLRAGVTPPVAKPMVAATGGASAMMVSRAYVYTLVTRGAKSPRPLLLQSLPREKSMLGGWFPVWTPHRRTRG